MVYRPRSGHRIAEFVKNEPACILTTREGINYAKGLRQYLHHIRRGKMIDYLEVDSPEAVSSRDSNLRGRKVVLVASESDRKRFSPKLKDLHDDGVIREYFKQQLPRRVPIQTTDDPHRIRVFAQHVGKKLRNVLEGKPSSVMGVKSGGVPFSAGLRDFLAGECNLDVNYAEINKEPKIGSQIRREQVEGRIVIITDDAISTGDTYGAISEGLEEIRERGWIPKWFYVVERDFQGMADYSFWRVRDLETKIERESVKILVVDNYKPVTDIVRRYLLQQDYTVDTASNADEAIDRIKGRAHDPYDIVISDISLGNGTDRYAGLRVLKEAKESGIKGIPMSGDTASHNPLARGLLGLMEYVEKPINKKRLFDLVKKSLTEEI